VTLLPSDSAERTNRAGPGEDEDSRPAEPDKVASPHDDGASIQSDLTKLGGGLLTALGIVHFLENIETTWGRIVAGVAVAVSITLLAVMLLRRHRARAVRGTLGLFLVGLAIGFAVSTPLAGDDTELPAARVEAAVELGAPPSAVDAAESGVWVTTLDSTLARVDQDDPYTRRGPSVRLPGDAYDVAAGRRTVFVTVAGDALAFDADNGRPLWRTKGLAKTDSEIEFKDGALFIENPEAGLLVRLDPNTGRALRTVRLPDRHKATAMTIGFGSLWVAANAPGAAPDRLLRYDLEGRLVASIALDRSDAGDLAAGERYIFIAHGEGSLTRVDPIDNRVAGRPVELRGVRASGVAAGGGGIWIPAARSGTVTQLSEPDGRVLRTLRVGDNPLDPVVAHGKVWVPLGGSRALVPIAIGD
jgi:hypothetical protein